MSEKTQKIYTKLVYHMATGEMIESESYDYAGPMALCDGEETPWSEALPPDVREWDEVKQSESPEKFWDQMINMRSHIGQSIRIPSTDAGDEDKAAFYTKLKEKVPGLMSTPNFEDADTLGDLYSRMGRPAKAKDYKIPEFKDSKDQLIKNLDLTTIEAFKEQAHKAGLTQKQFTDAVSSFVNPNITKHEQVLEKNKGEQDALAEEWGTAHERNSRIVENFLKHTDAPESVLNAIKSGAANKTSMVWFHKLASQSLRGDNTFQDDASTRGVMTPDEATIKISEIRNNKTHPYNNKQDPGNKAAKQYMRDLYLIKNPKTGTDNAPGTNFRVGGDVNKV